MARTIVVLNDGETWTEVDRCAILTIGEAEFQALADGDADIEDIDVISAFILRG